MERIKEDFNKRKAELDEYFNFLKLLDKDRPILHYSEMGSDSTYNVESELIKILKANGFLLIYNLVESFCREFIIEILREIQGEKLTLEKLSEKIRKIWIAQRVRNFRDPKTSNEKLENCIDGIATGIFEDTVVEFTDLIKSIENNERYDAFGLSGSIDKEKIQKLAGQYGFDAITPPEKERCGAYLKTVKDQRNKLAHGRITFAECGKDKSVTEMVAYKDNAVVYLTHVLLNIETYLEHGKYKKPRVSAIV